MVSVQQIIDWIDSWAPFRYAQSWDNSGLQVGNPSALIDRLMVSLDPGSEVLEEASRLGCLCLVTHHPLLLRPIHTVRTDTWPGTIIARALAEGISIVAAHTNLDAAREGTNAQLSRILGLKDVKPIETEPGFSKDAGYLGIGLCGTLSAAVALETLAGQLSAKLDGADIRITGDPRKNVLRAAICTGSGGSLMEKVLAAGAEVFITGDIKYHESKLAQESGLAILDIGHFASEKLILEPLARFFELKARSEGVHLETFISKTEKDPFRVIAGKC